MKKKYRTLRQHHPVEFLNEVIFRPNYQDYVKGVGFKLHPQQLLKYSKWKSIWPELAGLKNLKIINLRRENLLRSYVSGEIAKKTGVYLIAHQDKREMVKIQINSGKWHKYMTAREQEQIDFKRRFNHHAIYNMTYERLIDNRTEELEKVQKFLNLPEHDLSARLVKQNPYPLNEIITNFDELKREHANTEWSHFFTEQS